MYGKCLLCRALSFTDNNRGDPDNVVSEGYYTLHIGSINAAARVRDAKYSEMERRESSASSGSSSGGGGEAVDFLDELDDEVKPAPAVPAHASRRKSSAGSSLGDTTELVPLDDEAAPAPASAPPSLPRGPDGRGEDDSGASAPDWILMLRRVFEAARLSDVRLQRFVERLGVMEYKDGATIVQQGEMGYVV